jgi:hypothetical protein
MQPVALIFATSTARSKDAKRMTASFRRHPQHLRDLVDTMIAWNLERVILAHGRWYLTNSTVELSRAFCWIE